MKATITGLLPLEKGYLYFVTYESKNASIDGLATTSYFSKTSHEIGDSVDIYSRKTTSGYKYYERKTVTDGNT